MKVSPQKKMAHPQAIKVLAVKRHGLPEDFVYFPAVWSAIVTTRICAESSDCLRSVTVVGTESLCASGLHSPELSAHMDASITRTGRNG